MYELLTVVLHWQESLHRQLRPTSDANRPIEDQGHLQGSDAVHGAGPQTKNHLYLQLDGSFRRQLQKPTVFHSGGDRLSR